MPATDSGACRQGFDVKRDDRRYRGFFSKWKGNDGGASEVTRAQDSRGFAA
jgi:hypothetical protein